MKHLSMIGGVVVLLMLAMATCYGQDRSSYTRGRMGIGFVVGEPTGIAWKYRIDASHAVDGAFGVSPYNQFRMHVDYLWQSYPFQERNLAVHYGAGVAMGSGRTYFSSREVGFGVRGVAGLNFLIRNTPLDLFLEVAPILVMTPTSDMGADVGFGARAYF